jgi:hypothetical protein
MEATVDDFGFLVKGGRVDRLGGFWSTCSDASAKQLEGGTKMRDVLLDAIAVEVVRQEVVVDAHEKSGARPVKKGIHPSGHVDLTVAYGNGKRAGKTKSPFQGFLVDLCRPHGRAHDLTYKLLSDVMCSRQACECNIETLPPKSSTVKRYPGITQRSEASESPKEVKQFVHIEAVCCDLTPRHLRSLQTGWSTHSGEGVEGSWFRLNERRRTELANGDVKNDISRKLPSGSRSV